MSKVTKTDKGRAKALVNTVRQSKAPAISRAAAILRLLGRSDTPMSLQAISTTLGLVPSTCLYVLRALVAEELVAVDPDTKRYTLEAGVLTLARHWLRHNQFTDLAQPLLDELSRAYGVTVMGVNVVGLDHIIVVAVSEAGSNFRISAQIGSRFPALISATGRCIAAFGGYPSEDIEQRFNDLRWDDPPTFADWQQQVEETRQRGIAIDEGNYILGMSVLAAPVWKGPGQLGHALVALGVRGVSQLPDMEKLRTSMIAAADSVSQRLGGAAPTSVVSN